MGAVKLAGWLRDEGYRVTEWEGPPGLALQETDLVALSVIFSWHAPKAAQIALTATALGAEVWCGGPGMFTMGNWWREQTGMECHRGLDLRFDRQPGSYEMTFASRGCPVGCSFCIVPKLEGKEFTLDWDFTPAPILCDNNLSALPVDFQEHIIRRYGERGIRLRDANSGFEPRTFDCGTYQRWKPLLRGPWRFAFDEMAEEREVEAMMAILRTESRKRKRVYVLIGNESEDACLERATKVLEWGCEPYCQPLLPLNALSRRAYKIAHGWTAQRLTDFARYYNRHLWKYVEWGGYDRKVRTKR